MGTEVLDDNLHLLRDVVRVQLHPAHDPLQGGAAFHLDLVDLLALVRKPERHLVSRVFL